MPRFVIFVMAAVVMLLIALVGLSMLDREVPQEHVERPLSNVAQPGNAAQ